MNFFLSLSKRGLIFIDYRLFCSIIELKQSQQNEFFRIPEKIA